jgi:hypothetical protein
MVIAGTGPGVSGSVFAGAAGMRVHVVAWLGRVTQAERATPVVGWELRPAIFRGGAPVLNARRG